MNTRLILTGALTLFGAFSILATPAQGGIILIGGENGTTDPPSPTEGAQTEEDWNPTVTCSVGEGQGILDLLTCLEDEISNPPPACNSLVTESPSPQRGPVEIAPAEDPDSCAVYPHDRSDFNVWILLPPPNRWGIEIRRLDGSEISRLTLRENDPGIQTTELQLAANSHIARIRLVEDQPTGIGEVAVVVNDTLVSVPTGLFPTVLEINAEIIRQLRRAYFDVTVAGEFLHVRFVKLPLYDGVQRVQFRSTDPGIIRSDLSLLPDDAEELERDFDMIPLD